jgi:hypothetical protein
MTTKQAARQKGKDLENYVADLIRAKGIDPKAVRDGASGAGNREKGDITTSMMILNQNAGIECKNHKALSIPEWWRQTKKLEALGREPVLVFKIDGELWEETKCVIYLETLMDLVVASNGKRIVEEKAIDTGSARDLKYKTQRAVSAMKELIRELEQYGYE